MDIIRRKPIVWSGTSREDIRAFADQARQRAGRELARLQEGLQPSDFKPMASVGIGAFEIRVHAEGAFRVIYAAKFAEAIYVFHAFQKKSRKTSKEDIRLARNRYRAMLKQRKAR